MPFVQGKCENCSGILTVDPSLKAAICPFCGTAYVVQDSINYYNTTIKVEAMHANVVNITDESSSEARLKAGEAYIKLGEYAKAEKEYRNVTELAPQNCKGWLGLIETLSLNYTKRIRTAREFEQLSKYANTIKILAPGGEGEQLLSDYSEYVLREEEKNASEISEIKKEILECKKKSDELKQQSNNIRETILKKNKKIETIRTKYGDISAYSKWFKIYLTLGITSLVFGFILLGLIKYFNGLTSMYALSILAFIMFGCAVAFPIYAINKDIKIKNEWIKKLNEAKQLEQEVEEMRSQRAEMHEQRENIKTEISKKQELIEKYK